MKDSVCCFCSGFDGEACLGELFTAYREKRKRVLYHVDCVMWSSGILRKNYADKADYITHLYEASTKRECTKCGNRGPTIMYKNAGKIKEYYHYLCARGVGMDINNDNFVTWISFEEEVQKNRLAAEARAAEDAKKRNSQNNIEEVTYNDYGDNQKRKRKNDEITSSSSTTLSEEDDDEERYEKIEVEEEMEYKKPKDNNYESKTTYKSILETPPEENMPQLYSNNSQYEYDFMQQQHQMQNNHSDIFLSPFSPMNKNDTSFNSLYVSPTQFKAMDQQQQKQQKQQQQQFPPPLSSPPSLIKQPPLPLTPTLLHFTQQNQQQQEPPPPPQQQQSSSSCNRQAQSLTKEVQFEIQQQPSPIIPPISRQQQIQIMEQQKSKMSITAISSVETKNLTPIFNNLTRSHILESQISKKKTQHRSVTEKEIETVCTTSSDIPSCNTSPSSAINIESSDNNNNNSLHSSSSSSILSPTNNNNNNNNIKDEIENYCDFQIETDIDIGSKNFSNCNSNSNSSNSNTTYQLPPDNTNYTSSNSWNYIKGYSICNINNKIDYKTIFKHKDNGEAIQYNMFLEERDILEVRILQKNKVICDGLFISLFGPSSYMDSLRSNKPLDIQLETGLPEEEFSTIFNNTLASQISLIRLVVKEYSATCPLKSLFTRLSQNKLVGYLDYNEYELFIIPSGMNIMNCASFNFIIDRYMRNGPVVPAWVLLITKGSNNTTKIHSSKINH